MTLQETLHETSPYLEPPPPILLTGPGETLYDPSLNYVLGRVLPAPTAVNLTLMVRQLAYWHGSDRDQPRLKGRRKDGHHWIRITGRNWPQLFPSWDKHTHRKLLGFGRSKGILRTFSDHVANNVRVDFDGLRLLYQQHDTPLAGWIPRSTTPSSQPATPTQLSADVHLAMEATLALADGADPLADGADPLRRWSRPPAPMEQTPCADAADSLRRRSRLPAPTEQTPPYTETPSETPSKKAAKREQQQPKLRPESSTTRARRGPRLSLRAALIAGFLEDAPETATVHELNQVDGLLDSYGDDNGTDSGPSAQDVILLVEYGRRTNPNRPIAAMLVFLRTALDQGVDPPAAAEQPATVRLREFALSRRHDERWPADPDLREFDRVAGDYAAAGAPIEGELIERLARMVDVDNGKTSPVGYLTMTVKGCLREAADAGEAIRRLESKVQSGQPARAEGGRLY